MPILLFAGDKDMMCAHTGIAATIEAMTWGGLKGFVSRSLHLVLGLDSDEG